MAKPQISYNYDHNSDTTTIVTVEKVNGQVVKTTKTLEGNQIPEKSFLPKSTVSKIILGLLALGLILQVLESAPQIIVTPAAIFGAVKFTKNKTKLEKTIAITAAAIVSLVACSFFVKTLVPSTSLNSSNKSDYIITDSGKKITREQLREVRRACIQLIEASGSNDTEQCWKYSDQ